MDRTVKRGVGSPSITWIPYLDRNSWRLESVFAASVLPVKEVELLNTAFGASYTHMYAPGTRRHIRTALKAAASVE